MSTSPTGFRSGSPDFSAIINGDQKALPVKVEYTQPGTGSSWVRTAAKAAGVGVVIAAGAFGASQVFPDQLSAILPEFAKTKINGTNSGEESSSYPSCPPCSVPPVCSATFSRESIACGIGLGGAGILAGVYEKIKVQEQKTEQRRITAFAKVRVEEEETERTKIKAEVDRYKAGQRTERAIIRANGCRSIILETETNGTSQVQERSSLENGKPLPIFTKQRYLNCLLKM